MRGIIGIVRSRSRSLSNNNVRTVGDPVRLSVLSSSEVDLTTLEEGDRVRFIDEDNGGDQYEARYLAHYEDVVTPYSVLVEVLPGDGRELLRSIRTEWITEKLQPDLF